MGGKCTILFQVIAGISVTWKFDSKNPLKPFETSARHSQDFLLMLLSLLPKVFVLSRCSGWLRDSPATGQGGTAHFHCKDSSWQGPVSLPCPQALSLLSTPFPPIISFHISFSIRKPFALACFFIFSFTCLLQDKLQHWFYHKIMLIGSINHNDYIKVSVLHPPGLQKVL